MPSKTRSSDLNRSSPWPLLVLHAAIGLAAAPALAQRPAHSAAAGTQDQLFAGVEQFSRAQPADSVAEQSITATDERSRAALAAATGEPALVSRLDFLVQHLFFYNQPRRFSQHAVDVYLHRLDDAEWICLVHTRTPDTAVEICERRGAPAGTHELAIITVGLQELMFLHARGRLSLAQMEELSTLSAPSPEWRSIR